MNLMTKQERLDNPGQTVCIMQALSVNGSVQSREGSEDIEKGFDG